MIPPKAALADPQAANHSTLTAKTKELTAAAGTELDRMIREQPRLLFGRERTAPGALAEVANELLHARLLGTGGVATEQPRKVSRGGFAQGVGRGQVLFGERGAYA